MTTKQRTITLFSSATTILLIPLIAKQFSDSVHWSISDFLIAGILLFGTASAIDLTMRKVKSNRNRFIICAVLFTVLLLVWAEMAVGIFGSPISGS